MLRRFSLGLRLITSVAFLCAMSPVYGAEKKEGSLKLVKTFEGAKLYSLDNISVVVLSGSFRQMGRQYGTLLGEKIKQFYEEAINKPFIASGLFSKEELEVTFAQGAWKAIPKRQKELILGIAQESGLAREKVICASSVLYIQILARKKFAGPSTSCSSAAIWGSYTADGKTLTARNYDFPDTFRKLAKDFLTVVVYRPSDGSNSLAGIGFAGSVSFIDAMNDKGMYLESNNGVDSGGMVLFTGRTEAFSQPINILFDADDRDEFDIMINSIRPSYPMILMMADATSARYYEAANWDIRKRGAGEDQAIAAANQFMDPSWGILALPGPAVGYSSLRQSNLLSLAKGKPAGADEKYMMSILDVGLYNEDWSLGKGAALLKKNPNNNEVTVWQVVTSPSKKIMHLRLPTLTEWVLIDLNELLK